MNKKKAKSKSFDNKLKELSKLVNYSYHWYADVQDECDGYKIGGAETLAHMIACFFAQELDIDGVETAYTRDFFKLDEYGKGWNKSHFYSKLRDFTKELLTQE